MKALSIHQPWADLIVRGLKDVENRTWTTRYRGPVLIHAGAKFDQRRVTSQFYGPKHEWLFSGVVGVADLVDVVTNSKSPWAFPEQNHWILANPRRVPYFAMKGKLSLFEVPWPPAELRPESPEKRDEIVVECDAAVPQWPKDGEGLLRMLDMMPSDLITRMAARLEVPAAGDVAATRRAIVERYGRKLATVIDDALEPEEIRAFLTASGQTLSPRTDIMRVLFDCLEASAADFSDEKDIGDDADEEADEARHDDEEELPGELMARLGVNKDENFLYFVDRNGDVARARMKGKQVVEVVANAGVEKEDGFLYFIDRNGDIRRVQDERKRRKRRSN